MASSYGTDADKCSLRDAYRRMRADAPEESRRRADEVICRNLVNFPPFAEAPLVLTYVSCGSEVDTRALIAGLLARGRRVAVPRCDVGRHQLGFCEIVGLDELASGTHGLLEPASDAPVMNASELVGSACLVPGLVFDAQGQRVGYGGGYYDRFLAFYPGEKIGLARLAQISSNPLPHDAHDVAVDFIVTEGGAWSCR